MWLSQKISSASPSGEAAPLGGHVTLSGSVTAAQTDAEWRDVIVCGPGGYRWRPSPGDNVLILKDPHGKKPYALAAAPKGQSDLEEGEILVSTGHASLKLHPDGLIELTGHVLINGHEVSVR